MPVIHLRITRDGVTTAQKAEIVREFTDTLVRILGKRPEHTHVIIDEVDADNWGFAGVLTTEYRRSASTATPVPESPTPGPLQSIEGQPASGR